MALAQLVVTLCLLALSWGNKDVKADFMSHRPLMNTTPRNVTDEQKEDKHTRFLRWALNSPTEEFKSVPFSPDVSQENHQFLLRGGSRRSAAMMLNAAPPLDKIDGRYVTRELVEPDFEGLDSLEGFGINRFDLHPELESSHSELKQLRRKRYDHETISGLNNDVRLVKRNLDMIDKAGWPLTRSNDRVKKGGLSFSKKMSGQGFALWEKKNFDDSDQYGYNDFRKRNFDEIDRAGFHSLGRRNFDETDRASFHTLGRRNFDEIDRSGFHSLGKRNFDEIDRAGFHSLGKRNFDEIDRAGFHSLGRRNFDEIDRAGFHSLGRRNFDEIDKSAFRNLGKRHFDEIDRTGFRSFGKRNFDEIDRSGFRELGKRSSDHSDDQVISGGSSKDSVEVRNLKNKESRKLNFEDVDKAPVRNFSKRSTTDEDSEIST